MSPPPLTVVVLAAGLGTRLGRPHPKPLTPLEDGRTILRRQLDHVRASFGPDVPVLVVVGFGKEQVMAAAARDAAFVYNERFAETNTSKSLLRALQVAAPGGVLWLNGDVVFAPALLDHLAAQVDGTSFVAVDTAATAEEEVKYTLDGTGHVAELSKRVVGGLGEAVGINFVAAHDRSTLTRRLAAVRDDDYFERGIEVAIAEDGMRVRAIDISAYGAVEVDVDEDLARANLVVPVV